jgi:hypothetical protein
MNSIQKHANDAVFMLQLPASQAINYIARNSGATYELSLIHI